MTLGGPRVERLKARVEEQYGGERAGGVRELLSDLDLLGVKGLEKFLSKLERALTSNNEFYATLREGVFARYLARNGAVPEFEPKGAKGPDLGIESGASYANLEIKRLLDGDALVGTDDLESWYRDETDPSFEPEGVDRLADKVRGVVTDATKQLIFGEPNVIVLSDWSVSVTRGHFRRAIESLEEEIATNGTYGRISAVQYDSNFLGSTNSYLWLNSGASVPLPPPVMVVLEAVAREEASAFRDAVQRATASDR